MGLFDIFCPNERNSSAYQIDYEEFYNRGYRGVIFDVDNTLVKHGAPADEKSRELFLRLKNLGMKAIILSNNGKARVKSFAEDAGDVMYIHMANKPFKSGYIKAMEKMGTDVSTTMFVGDQIFTDIIGAKRLGIYCILTEPIDEKEEIQIVLKRRAENVVLEMIDKKEKKSS